MKDIMDFLTPFLFLTIGDSIGGCLVLAYVVPIIPYIIYTMAVMGWIMAVTHLTAGVIHAPDIVWRGARVPGSI